MVTSVTNQPTPFILPPVHTESLAPLEAQVSQTPSVDASAATQPKLEVSPIALAILMLGLVAFTTVLYYRRNAARPGVPDLDYLRAIDQDPALKRGYLPNRR